MLYFLSHAWDQAYYQIRSYTEAALILGVLEYFLPIEKGQSFKGRLIAWSLNVLTSIIASLSVYPLSLLSAKINPAFTVDLMILVNKGSLFYLPYLYLIVPLIPLFVNDFFFYVWHRLQHKIPFLWRFHSLHHSVEELNATSPLQHWSEATLQFLTISTPAVALFHFNYESVGYLYLYLRLWNGIIHCNSRIEHPFFNWVLAGPQFHRIHHSIEPQHFDKNFAFFPLWDFIFRTHYNPKKREFPKTGIRGRTPCRDLKSYFIWGITNKRAKSDILRPEGKSPVNSLKESSMLNSL